jgi:histone H3/H4
VASKLREAVRSHDIRMAGEFIEALNEQVHELISKAVKRAKGNKRGTVRPDDL